MNIEEAINRYLELKPCKNWIESIEPSFFFEFAETVLTAYKKEKETSHYNQSQLDIANAKLVEEKEKNKEYKNLLIDMVNQFAYEDFNPKTRGSSEQNIYTAGLSTLEDVFDLLDIDEGIKREDLWKLKEE